MDDCFYAPLLFGETNHVPKSTITSNVVPDTPLEWLKNEDPAEQVRWTSPPGDAIQIEIFLDAAEPIGYFGIPTSNLTADAAQLPNTDVRRFGRKLRHLWNVVR